MQFAPRDSSSWKATMPQAPATLIAGGQLGIFTSNYFFLARRPAK
jgi:hypothetical protein